MKVLQIVGVRKSGKTTTVENLVKELKHRGYRVGTLKCINCPLFSLDSDKKTNTARHAAAGADVVVAFGRREVDFIYPEPMDISRTLALLEPAGLDFCIVEGGYEFDLPRVVCLGEPVELAERLTEKTFAVAGVAADSVSEISALPRFNALDDESIGELAGFIEKNVPQLTLPVKHLERPASCRGFCKGCSGHHSKSQDA